MDKIDSASMSQQNRPGILPRPGGSESSTALPEDRISITGRRAKRAFSNSAAEMAQKLFEPSTYSFRKNADDHAVVYAGPFVGKDGAFQVLDFKELLRYDGASLTPEVAQQFEYDKEGPDHSGAVFTAEGTCVFLSHDRRLRAFRDGHELFSVPIGEQPNSPVAATDSLIAYASRDGKVNVHGSDGALRESYTVPLKQGEKEDTWVKPRHVFIDSRERVYLLTCDNELMQLKNGGAAWSAGLGAMPRDQFRKFLLESGNGETVYCRAERGLAAVECDSGKIQWSADLGSLPAVSPVTDDKGNLYVLTKDGKISVISPDGKKLRDWDTGIKPDIVNSANPRLLIDCRGNVCITPNPCSFHVYTAEGDPIVKLKCGDLFREVDYIQDFSLTPDGKKTILLAGSYFVGEMELPSTSAQKYREAQQNGAASEAESADIIQEDEYVIIGGIRLDTKKEYHLLSLIASGYPDPHKSKEFGVH
ncbi:MAG: PQQ-binding-like beta-propeller repeat protein [Candidatus Eremiobacteraeota bacterium]|nr:PQQ-binding-like beta-propeller repeat protein [Candidatus Eremiobacteraeota bacterium]